MASTLDRGQVACARSVLNDPWVRGTEQAITFPKSKRKNAWKLRCAIKRIRRWMILWGSAPGGSTQALH